MVLCVAWVANVLLTESRTVVAAGSDRLCANFIIMESYEESYGIKYIPVCILYME